MQELINSINHAVSEFRDVSSENPIIRIITHNDCDGLTSGSILARALKRADFQFWITTVRQLDKKVIEQIKKEKVDIFFILDLSCDFKIFENIESKIFILDHHEIKNKTVPKNLIIVNPFLNQERDDDEICGAGLTYLFAKTFDERNKDLSNLAVVGMVGDVLGGNISKISNIILKDSDVTIKKSLPLLYTNMPISKALEFSSNLFIPGVTGSASGAIDLLRETGIEWKDRTLAELDEHELSKLITSIVLRRINDNLDGNIEGILDNVYSLKFRDRIEDARELSALLNACGRLGYGDVAIEFCFGSVSARAEAEDIYRTYRNYIAEGINYIKNTDMKRESEKYIIYSCKDAVRDSVIGTIMSIMSLNSTFPQGKILVGMANKDDGKIKVSTRVSKDKNAKQTPNNINMKEVICEVCNNLGMDDSSGGHAQAAGCLVPIEREEEFINALENTLNKIK